MEKYMDFKVQKKTLELLYKLLEGTNGIIPFVSYYPQKEAFPGWKEEQSLKRAIPETQGVSSTYLKQFLEELMGSKEINLHGVMIVRNGCVLAETMTYPYQKKLWHATYSLCKSITGIAIGMMIDEGNLGLDDRVVDRLPSKINPFNYLKYKNLTIRHLLTMTSGAAFNEMGAVTEEDWVKAYFESHVRFSHGSQFSYNSMNSYILSAIITEVTGMTMMQYLQERLWSPLGIKNVYLESCPMGNTKGGWGLYLTMEDMAKIAQMYLQKGLWKGRRILSEEWIHISCQKQVDIDEDNGFSYGFHNWILEEERAFLFNGMLGQNIVFYPDKRMFLITIAGNNELFADGPMMKLIRTYFGNQFCPGEVLKESKLEYEKLKAFEKRCGEPSKRTYGIQGGWKFLKPVGLKQKGSVNVNGARRIRPGENQVNQLWETVLGYVDGKIYQMDTNKGALVPRFLQAVHNNYSEGIKTVSFKRDREHLIFYVKEGENTYTLLITEKEDQIQELVYHQEEYKVGAKGIAMENEDGIMVLKIKLSFLETPHERIIKCFFMNETIHIRFEEQPGWKLVQDALSTVIRTENSIFVQGLMAKLDPEYMKYKVRMALETEVMGQLVCR